MATAAIQPMTSALASSHATGAPVNTPTPPPLVPGDIVDPPNGSEIRRQVEYYFSDENLPTDLHLLECCRGRKNEPVSIGRISGWGKMKPFRPARNIAAALMFSSSLEVTADRKRVSRKVPYAGLTILDDEFPNSEDDIAHDPTSPENPLSQGGQKKRKKKKKKKKKPATDRSLNQEKQPKNFMDKPTGFEARWVEPPVTPEEDAKNKEIYDPEIRFTQRIESAIQMFKEKRRMHEMYAHVFNKLMRFGGVESSPRLFQGNDKQVMKTWSTAERIENLANHMVPADREDNDKWEVDFVALAKAFLSSWYPAHYGYAPEKIKNACQVPRSFYNYLRYHRVCPEYDDQLAQALKICDMAEEELPKAHQAGLILPGDFNKSASSIHGGAYAGLYSGDQSWVKDMKKDGIDAGQVGIRDEEARIKFGAGVAIMGSDEQYEQLENKSLTVFEHFAASLEVIDIILPTDETCEMFKEQDKISGHKIGAIEPLGKLICKTWVAEDCDEWDLPKDKYPTGKPHRSSTGQTYEFWVEESILGTCFKGLKIDAKVLQLSGGITILDEVHETMCSFFTWIPNELWMEKKPRKVRWMSKRLAGSDEVEEDQAKIQEKAQQLLDAATSWTAEGKGQEDGKNQDGDDDMEAGEMSDDDCDDETWSGP